LIREASDYWLVEDPYGNSPYAVVRSARGGGLIWAASKNKAAGVARSEDDAYKLEESLKDRHYRKMKALIIEEHDDRDGLALLGIADTETASQDKPEYEAYYIHDTATNKKSTKLFTARLEATAFLEILRTPPAPDETDPADPSMRLG